MEPAACLKYQAQAVKFPCRLEAFLEDALGDLCSGCSPEVLGALLEEE